MLHPIAILGILRQITPARQLTPSSPGQRFCQRRQLFTRQLSYTFATPADLIRPMCRRCPETASGDTDSG